MGLFDIFKGPTPEQQAANEASARRQADILMSLRANHVPQGTQTRLTESATGRRPWMATLTPAELRIARDHGLTPIATISATCWLHYGWSWTEGHAQGWQTALERLKQEARACGANAVLDVKMRTIALGVEDSMDFTLIGTAVKLANMPASADPVVATVPALEFVKLLEADVVTTGIAIGAHYEWLTDWNNSASRNMSFFNTEARQLSHLWDSVRQRAHSSLRQHARAQGNGVLAHVNFSQMFEVERNETKQYLARHIVVATIVDTRRGADFPHDVQMVVDMREKTPLTGTKTHHQSYGTNEQEGAL